MGARTVYSVLEDARATCRRTGPAPADRQKENITATLGPSTSGPPKRSPAAYGGLGIGKGRCGRALAGDSRRILFGRPGHSYPTAPSRRRCTPHILCRSRSETCARSTPRLFSSRTRRRLDALARGRGRFAAAGSMDLADRRSRNAITLEQLRAQGREALAENPNAFEKIRARFSPKIPAVLYLTSGATGEPKMALVTHRGAGRQHRYGTSRAAALSRRLHHRLPSFGAYRAAHGAGAAAYPAWVSRSGFPRVSPSFRKS